LAMVTTPINRKPTAPIMAATMTTGSQCSISLK
jgi:hypothetical protein